jgi:hypothetical protein
VLESGEHGTLAQLSAPERISRSYICRVLRLTLLTLNIVERVMDRVPTAGLARLLEPYPVEREKQREQFLTRSPASPMVWSGSASARFLLLLEAVHPILLLECSRVLQPTPADPEDDPPDRPARTDPRRRSAGYVSRILRPTLRAADIVEAILAGRTDQSLMLETLERPLPASWEEQRGHLGWQPARGRDQQLMLESWSGAAGAAVSNAANRGDAPRAAFAEGR